MLLKLLKEKNMKAYELANILGIHISQIYKWDKNGIPESNPHAAKLKQLFPTLKFTPGTKRSKAGRPKQQLNLTETNIPAPPEERPRQSEFPTVVFKKRT
jgi:transcriptional regulator with XRE-family HTH domain